MRANTLNKSSPVFIVGTGRCGSTLMSNLINIHPDILSLSEVFVSFATEGFVRRKLDGPSFWKMLSQASPVLREAINPSRSPVEFLYEFNSASPWTMADLPACLYMTLPHLSDTPDALYQELEPLITERPMADLGEHYQFWFDWMTKRQGKQMWIERSGNSITMVPSLNRVFNNAKFAHLHRDGREVAMSIQKFMPLRVFLYTWTAFKRLGIDLLKSPFRYSDSRLINALSPLVTKVLPINRFLDTEPSLGEVGRFWSAMVQQGMRDLGQIESNRLHTMSYANLVQQPEKTLSDFMDFAAPNIEKQAWLAQVANIPRKQTPAWRSLPAAKLQELEDACAPGMALLGYH